MYMYGVQLQLQLQAPSRTEELSDGAFNDLYMYTWKQALCFYSDTTSNNCKQL